MKLGVGSHILNIILSRFLSAIRETILPFSAALYHRCRLGRWWRRGRRREKKTRDRRMRALSASAQITQINFLYFYKRLSRLDERGPSTTGKGGGIL